MPEKQQNLSDSLGITISLTREQWAIHSLLLRSAIPDLEQPLWGCADDILKMFEASLNSSHIHQKIQTDIEDHETK